MDTLSLLVLWSLAVQHIIQQNRRKLGIYIRCFSLESFLWAVLNRLTLILAGTASFKKECFFIPSLPTSVMSKNQVQHVTMYDRINIYRKRHRALHNFVQYFHMKKLKKKKNEIYFYQIKASIP